MSATTTLDGRSAVRPVERAGATGAPVLARAARPRAATPVFVDGGRRARLFRALGRVIALALTGWIALTAVALVGPHWADGIQLRSDRTVAHTLPGADDASPADDATDGVPLFTAPSTTHEATPAAAPGPGLLGPVAPPEQAATAPVTQRPPDAQDRGGAALAHGSAVRGR